MAAHQAPVPGILQARTLEWVAISYSWVSAQHRDWTYISSMAGSLLDFRQILYCWATSKAHSESEIVSHSVLPDFLWPHGLQPAWLLCHGIFQSRILEWFAISFSRGSSQPRDQTWVSCRAGRFFTDWATRDAYSVENRNELLMYVMIWINLKIIVSPLQVTQANQRWQKSNKLLPEDGSGGRYGLQAA